MPCQFQQNNYDIPHHLGILDAEVFPGYQESNQSAKKKWKIKRPLIKSVWMDRRIEFKLERMGTITNTKHLAGLMEKMQ